MTLSNPSAASRYSRVSRFAAGAAIAVALTVLLGLSWKSASDAAQRAGYSLEFDIAVALIVFPVFHGLVIFPCLALASLGNRLFRVGLSTSSVALVAAVPSWLNQRADLVALVIAVLSGWAGSTVARKATGTAASRVVITFVLATSGFNIFYAWLSIRASALGHTLGMLFVLAIVAFGYGSTAGALFSKRKRGAVIANEFIEQRNTTRKVAVQQASERGVNVIREARQFGSDYSFATKRHSWDYFDAAMGILVRYPPQLGMAVLSELGQHTGRLGYNPVGEVIIAMSHLDKDFTPDEVSRFNNIAAIRTLEEDKPERMRRAALTLARVMYGSETLEGAVKMYESMTDPRSEAVIGVQMKAHIDSALLEVNPTLGAHIISRGEVERELQV